MNILLVDDEALELDQLEYLIKPHFPHWIFYRAQDASIALNLAKRIKFDIAFLDIQMPGKSGLELAEELINLYDLNVIMVTAFQKFEYAQTSIRIGVNDYITKPIIENELLNLLEKYKQLSVKSNDIQDALTIIKNEFSEKLTLSSVASRVYLNPSYLSRKFYEETGMGFADFLNTYRLEAAKKMLTGDTTLSMAAIAEKSGFNSQNYFSSMFRKKYGISPSKFNNTSEETDRNLL